MEKEGESLGNHQTLANLAASVWVYDRKLPEFRAELHIKVSSLMGCHLRFPAQTAKAKQPDIENKDLCHFDWESLWIFHFYTAALLVQ